VTVGKMIIPCLEFEVIQAWVFGLHKTKY